MAKSSSSRSWRGVAVLVGIFILACVACLASKARADNLNNQAPALLAQADQVSGDDSASPPASNQQAEDSQPAEPEPAQDQPAVPEDALEVIESGTKEAEAKAEAAAEKTQAILEAIAQARDARARLIQRLLEDEPDDLPELPLEDRVVLLEAQVAKLKAEMALLRQVFRATLGVLQEIEQQREAAVQPATEPPFNDVPAQPQATEGTEDAPPAEPSTDEDAGGGDMSEE